MKATSVHLDPQHCRQCGGLCCQGHPGLWVDPERFLTLFFAAQRLNQGELQRRLPPLGMELRDLGGVMIPAPLPGVHGCSALTTAGCAYPPETRPCQCLAMIPEFETLLTGENHCRLPAAAGSNQGRKNWRAYWASFNPTDR